MVHGDLKPENIVARRIVDSNGQVRFVVKLIDLAAAGRAYTPPMEYTISHMAPEVAFAVKNAAIMRESIGRAMADNFSIKYDCHALGQILIEVMHGRHYFSGSDWPEASNPKAPKKPAEAAGPSPADPQDTTPQEPLASTESSTDSNAFGTSYRAAMNRVIAANEPWVGDIIKHAEAHLMNPTPWDGHPFNRHIDDGLGLVIDALTERIPRRRARIAEVLRMPFVTKDLGQGTWCFEGASQGQNNRGQQGGEVCAGKADAGSTGASLPAAAPDAVLKSRVADGEAAGAPASVGAASDGAGSVGVASVSGASKGTVLDGAVPAGAAAAAAVCDDPVREGAASVEAADASVVAGVRVKIDGVNAMGVSRSSSYELDIKSEGLVMVGVEVVGRSGAKGGGDGKMLSGDAAADDADVVNIGSVRDGMRGNRPASYSVPGSGAALDGAESVGAVPGTGAPSSAALKSLHDISEASIGSKSLVSIVMSGDSALSHTQLDVPEESMKSEDLVVGVIEGFESGGVGGVVDGKKLSDDAAADNDDAASVSDGLSSDGVASDGAASDPADGVRTVASSTPIKTTPAKEFTAEEPVNSSPANTCNIDASAARKFYLTGASAADEPCDDVFAPAASSSFGKVRRSLLQRGVHRCCKRLNEFGRKVQ